jgi:DNA-binding FadR family transcriptional regulator
MSVRTIRYQTIADDLRRRVADGEFERGVLPSEAELSAAYEASRVTIRRALEALRVEGLVESRQGFGGSSRASRCARTCHGWRRSTDSSPRPASAPSAASCRSASCRRRRAPGSC